MEHTDDLLDFAPLAPVEVPPHFEPEAQPSQPARLAPRPAYGLVGMPSAVITTRDIKTAAVFAGLGAAVATLFSMLGRARRSG